MDVSQYLDLLKQDNAYRSRIEIESRDNPYCIIDGKQYLNFCSNDYLGLSQNKILKQTFCDSVKNYGVGTGSSQLVCGYLEPQKKLEEQIANYLGYEKTVVFGSGYLANLGISQAIANNNSIAYLDKLNHASIYDGIKLSGIKYKRYPHLNVSSLLKYKEEHGELTKYIQSDAVFSMDGDILNAEEITNVAEKLNAKLIIDDAHGFGVIGKTGKGITEYFNKEKKPDLLLVTFGKALATYGAAVCGSSEVIDLLIQKSRSLIYTTALPAAITATTSKAIDLLTEESCRREKLIQSIEYFQEISRQSGLAFKPSNTPIQNLQIGSNEKALTIAEQLNSKKILAVAIRPPTVPANTARIRITITSNHEKEHLDQLIDALIVIRRTT